MEAFSDGVFAIAITLLVLAIDPPNAGASLGSELLALWPSYLAYVMSFVVIGAIWINHHAMFRHIARSDSILLILNLGQLLFIAFLPFPTDVLAGAFLSGVDESTATAFYGGTLAVLGVFVSLTWSYATRRPQLLDDRVSPEKARRLQRRYLVGPAGYAIGVMLGFVAPWLAVLVFIGLNAYFLWPQQRTNPSP